MKERPIIFSAPMVRAILAGAKTQTRRLVRPQPEDRCPLVKEWGNVFRNYAPHDAALGNVKMADGSWGRVQCPYGRPGDRLWVRETFRRDLDRFHSRKLLVYRADDAVVDAGPEGVFDFPDVAWRPGIHMPRWASRITLEITDVRLEQVQDISGMDAKREGVSVPAHIPEDGADLDYARRGFRRLWEEIHGGGSWEKNPWVWVIEFKKLEQQEQA